LGCGVGRVERDHIQLSVEGRMVRIMSYGIGCTEYGMTVVLKRC